MMRIWIAPKFTILKCGTFVLHLIVSIDQYGGKRNVLYSSYFETILS